MLLLFLILKIRRRFFAKTGGKRAKGPAICDVLENLSGLQLDRELRVPEDDERVAGEDMVARIGSLFIRRKSPKQELHTTETEMQPTRADDTSTYGVGPQTGVVRQTTWESVNGEVRYRTEREI